MDLMHLPPKFQTITKWKLHVRNDDNDIIITLQVPGTKEIDLLTIYRYFPSPNLISGRNGKLCDKKPCFLCDKHDAVKSDFSDTCLGSLYVRMEKGAWNHCKFERRPVQEIVYQLSDSDHLVFSPTLQTSTIKCTNGFATRVHFEQSTKINVPARCFIKLTRHEITSTDSAKIAPPLLRYSWSWDPFTLPSSLLSHPAHIDQTMSELRTNIFGMNKPIITTRTNSSTFEQMISKTNFNINYSSMFTWLALALAATANLGLLILSVNGL
jgi:hypothetical protein